MSLPSHGANPHRLYESMQLEMPAVIYDFSENVNAFGLPPKIREKWPRFIEKVTAYPDPKGEPFISSAAQFHKISPDALFIGNGAAEIFTLLANRYRGKKAIIVHPTFSEYEATLRAKDVLIEPIVATESTGFALPMAEIEGKMATSDVLYLCTPNNPTGILPSAADLKRLLIHGERVGCDIVLDEAFIDFVDESLSLIPQVNNHPHLLVVRSMTKMYAIPGIRLGYLVGHPSVIAEIREQSPHWNVSGIAAEIGALCFEEFKFVQKTKEHAVIEREKMLTFLRTYGCVVTDSVANYLVFKVGNPLQTTTLYKDLLAKGIVLRHTENFRGMNGRWLRIGMKKKSDMELLRKELRRWFEGN